MGVKDPDVSLDIVPVFLRSSPAVPVLGVDMGMGIGSQYIDSMEKVVFVFPVAEVRSGFTEAFYYP